MPASWWGDCGSLAQWPATRNDHYSHHQDPVPGESLGERAVGLGGWVGG